MVGVFEAKTHFSELIDKVYNGTDDELIIAKNGTPYVKIVRLDYGSVKKPRIGVAKGKYKDVPADFDEMDVGFDEGDF